MNSYLKEFEDHLNQVTSEVLDDFDSAPDDDSDSPGFKGETMFNQLGKVLDSQESPKPLNTVTTDDGKTFKVSADQAQILRMLATTDKVKPQVRMQFTKDIQTSNGLIDFLDIKDYHEIPALFVKKYLG
jgi:flagellar hook-associated protein FlgK